MSPPRGLSTLALVVAFFAGSSAFGQELPALIPPDHLPVVVHEIEPAAATEAKTDPLTDLMKRVTNLESELKRAKEKEQTRAADAAKKPTVNWMMQIQSDGIWSSQDAANKKAVGVIPDGVAFRRARFGLYGDYGLWEYRVAMEFASSGRPSFIDVYIGLNDIPGLGRVRVGHFFEPFSLEQYSQNRFVTFLERSVTSEPIAPGRNLGVMANNTVANERGTWAVGVFRTDSDVFGDDTGNDFQSAITGRATALLWYDEETQGRDLLHVGLAYSARATKNDKVQFRVRPEIRIGSADPNIPFFVDTGSIASHFYQLLGAELLWVRGPFSVQAEYVVVPVSTIDRGAVYFQSWYAMGSVFLTGENRTYRKKTGTLERIIPKRDFVKKDGSGLAWGPGAIELAARLSHIDLNDGGVTGGRLTDATVGVNWYMNPYVRMTMNYIKAFQSPVKGKPGTADFYGVRLGYEF